MGFTKEIMQANFKNIQLNMIYYFLAIFAIFTIFIKSINGTNFEPPTFHIATIASLV